MFGLVDFDSVVEITQLSNIIGKIQIQKLVEKIVLMGYDILDIQY